MRGERHAGSDVDRRTPKQRPNLLGESNRCDLRDVACTDGMSRRTGARRTGALRRYHSEPRNSVRPSAMNHKAVPAVAPTSFRRRLLQKIIKDACLSAEEF